MNPIVGRGNWATASTSCNEATEGARFLVDGSTATKWCADVGNPGGWWLIDLGQRLKIFSIKITHATSEDPTFVTKDFSISVADYPIDHNMATLPKCVDVVGNTSDPSYHWLSAPVTGRYILLNVTANTQNGLAQAERIYELEIDAVPVTDLFVPGFNGINFWTAKAPAAALTPLSWLSRWPDSIPAARRDVAAIPATASLSTLQIAPDTSPTLSWGGSFPERAGTPPRPVNGGGATSVTALSNLSVPGLPWIPKHPDRLDPPPRAPAEGHSASVTQLAALPVPNLSWSSKYPDRLDRPKRREDGFSVSETSLAAFPVPPLGWSGVYPDRIDLARRPVNDGGVTASLPAPPAAAAPALAWLSGFPDMVPGARRGPEGSITIEPWLSALPIPILSWLGVYPDGAARAPARPVLEGGMVGQPGISAYPIPLIAWLPSYPDGAARRAERAAEGFIAQHISQIGASLTPLAWSPRFEDFPGRAKPSPVQEGGAVGLVSLAAFPVPPLSWLANFPDGAARRAPRVAETFSVWTAGLANLAIPALSWGPRFVDPTWRPRLHQTQDFGGPVLPPGAPPAVPALSWGPSFPDFIFKTALREGTWAVASALPPPPPALSWGPSYPSILLRAQAAREGWKVDSLVQPFPPGLSFLPTFSGPLYPPRLREATWQTAPVSPVAPDSPPLAWAPFIPEPVRTGRVAHSAFASPTSPPAIFLPMWEPHYPNILRATPVHPMQHSTTRLDPPPPLTPADRMGWQPTFPAFIWPPANPMRFAVGGGVVVFLVAPTGELQVVMMEVGEWHALLKE